MNRLPNPYDFGFYDILDTLLDITMEPFIYGYNKIAATKKSEETKTQAKSEKAETQVKSESSKTAPAKKKTKLSPPWYTLRSKIDAFFKGDPYIYVSPLTDVENSNGTEKIIYIDTPDTDKAIGLQKILKPKYSFGNISVQIVIRVIDIIKTKKEISVKTTSAATYDDYLNAFVSTPAVEDIQKVKDIFNTEWIIIEFKKEVVQFYNDDLTDAYGNWNGLYTDIATDIFKYNDKVKYTIAITNE